MNVSYNWLRRYIDLKDDAETVAKIMTSIGLEVGTVEKIQTIRGGLEGLVVGEVVECIPHPNSDHLHITQTRIAAGEEPIQIVCGAPNVAAGQKVIVAPIGTVLYQGEESFVIKKGKIRGEESFGMICAEDEIGVGTDHAGIMVLPADTPVGLPVKEYFHVEDDWVIEMDITPNRNDAASHYGVARDLHAYYAAHSAELRITNYELHKPSVDAFKVQNHNLPIEVTVEDSEACPRYTGVSIQGVTVKESPEWLRKALNAIGVRSINNVVDVTNFVLFEMGQALHSFDADKISGHHIIVKRADEGQKFVTLDGVERSLDHRDLMICDETRPLCLAGVFGGLNSGVTEETKNVFLESAYFDPVVIRKTARRHGLNTDASFRYERGCDPNQTLYNLQRCALLIQEVAGGEISMEVADCRAATATAEAWDVTIDIQRVNSLIGKAIGEETIETILKALEIEIVAKHGDCWGLRVPRYRVDVRKECDVVEDILRIYGYNNVEFPDKVNTNLSFNPKPNPVAEQRKVSEQLTAQGFNEIMNNSLTKAAYYQNGSWSETCVRIMNPLSQDLSVMRQTLLFGGLESIQRNVNRKNDDLSFYEFGNCYWHDDSVSNAAKQGCTDASATAHAVTGDAPAATAAYGEEMHLGLWLTGNKAPESWVQATTRTSFYRLHAYVNMVLKRLGIAVDKLILEPAIDPDGEQCCGIADCFTDGLVLKTANGVSLGYMAIVNPKLLKQFDIDAPVYYADLYWKTLMKQRKQYKPVIKDLPKFPAVKRDFALLVDNNVLFADLRKAAFETEHKYLKDVYLFDVYEGKNLLPGKKSYALSFILQNEEDTLKDKQIESIMSRLQATFETKFNAKLR